MLEMIDQVLDEVISQVNKANANTSEYVASLTFLPSSYFIILVSSV